MRTRREGNRGKRQGRKVVVVEGGQGGKVTGAGGVARA